MDYSKFLLLTGIIILLFIAVYTYDTLENFENLMPTKTNEPYILLDSYPILGKLNENTTGVWKTYPISNLQTYSQITNNIKNPINPDDGTCSPLEFCNAFYKNKQIIKDTNIEINSSNVVRVGYFYQK